MKHVLIGLLLAAPLQAQTTLDKLRAEVREAVREARGESRALTRLEEAAADVESVLARLQRHVDSDIMFLRELRPCGEPQATPRTETTPIQEVERIPAEVDRAFDELSAAHDEVRRMLTPQSPRSFRDAVNRVLDTTEQILQRRRDSSGAARWLRRFADERRRSEQHQQLCRLLESVAPIPELFTLSELRRDPLLPLRRLDEAVQRQLTRRGNALQRGEWSLGAGVQWTPDEDHAGQPVGMVAFRPLPEDLPIFRDAPIRPWVQIGTSLRFDRPAFYVGGAIDVGPYMLAGVGWTAQKREQDFEGDIYVSFVLRAERLREWMGF
jgi:hypothetical protein